MTATIICPSEREESAFFVRHCPMALVPILGRTLLDRALSHLADLGYRHVKILAADRPQQIRKAVGQGNPWGLEVQVIPVPLHAHHLNGEHVFHLDHDLTDPSISLWKSPSEWFGHMQQLMSHAGATGVGMKEATPGVWLSTTARIPPNAVLRAPCWIGDKAWIGAASVIGPCAILEAGACVDGGAEVSHSFVGPDTYVGNHLELRDSLAWGTGLLNWRTTSFIEVTDAFLLADMSQHRRHASSGSWIERVLAAAVLFFTSPLLVLAWLLCQAREEDLFTARRCVRTPLTTISCPRTMLWYELNGFQGVVRRWPILWSIVKGDFRWIGNRPLTLEQAAELKTDFELQWLSVSPGLLSLADAEGDDGDHLSDSARAHAAYYAACHGWRTDVAILFRWLRRLCASLTARAFPPTHSYSQT